jgi:hypothetical protein
LKEGESERGKLGERKRKIISSRNAKKNENILI